MEYIKDTYCSYCGTKFVDQKIWPRKCFICWNESYKNPIPIVVSMIGVITNKGMGLLVQKRNIEPGKGGWALPSGYINHGETWEEAAVRENEEEMHVYTRPEDYVLYGIRKPASGNMLVFCYTKRLWEDQVTEFVERFLPNSEVSALGIFYGDTELVFPSHNECAIDYLNMSQWTI